MTLGKHGRDPDELDEYKLRDIIAGGPRWVRIGERRTDRKGATTRFQSRGFWKKRAVEKAGVKDEEKTRQELEEITEAELRQMAAGAMLRRPSSSKGDLRRISETWVRKLRRRSLLSGPRRRDQRAC